MQLSMLLKWNVGDATGYNYMTRQEHGQEMGVEIRIIFMNKSQVKYPLNLLLVHSCNLFNSSFGI